MNKTKRLAAFFAASLSLICLPVHAVVLLEVDLSVLNQVTITATTAASPVTTSGSATTGFYLADFFGGAASASLGTPSGSGNLSSAANFSNNNPRLFRSGDFDPGLNVWSYTSDGTSSFLASEQAFSGTATWTIASAAYNLAVAGPPSGDVYFPADSLSDLNSAQLLGTWAVIPELDARLANLALSAGTLNPDFSSDITSYTASVASATESITVTPTLADANATVTVNGSEVTSGQPSDPIALIVGDNTITVAVQGNTTETTTVAVSRSATIGGTLSGLAAGNQVVLRNNGIDELTLGSNGVFAFATEQLTGTDFQVEILTNPTSPNQLCEVTSGGTGTVGADNVTDIEVLCTTLTYTVGGTVSDLEGSGLVLANNGNELQIAGNGSFSFPAQADGSSYDVTVSLQPQNPVQICEVTNGVGRVSGEDVTTVELVCGSISDLLFSDRFEGAP